MSARTYQSFEFLDARCQTPGCAFRITARSVLALTDAVEDHEAYAHRRPAGAICPCCGGLIPPELTATISGRCFSCHYLNHAPCGARVGLNIVTGEPV